MMCTTFASLVVCLAALSKIVSSLPHHNSKGSVVQPLIPHHVQLQRTRSESHLRRTEAQQVDAAYQGYGTHYIDMWTGTPPQRQTLIISTGSPGIGFPCSNCIDCGYGYHVDRFFKETESLTFKTVTCGSCEVGHCNEDSTSPSGKCQAGFSYMEGSSWSGFEAKDMAYMGGPHDKALAKGEGDGEAHDDADPDQAREYQFELDFICQTSITGLFKTQLADGILGMGTSEHAYWYQAMKANVTKMDTSSFSLCFARQPTASREGTEAGAFTLGGFDERLHDEGSPVVYSIYDNMHSSDDFVVDLKGIYLRKGGGGDSALSTNSSIPIVELEISEEELNEGNVIVDSGSTDTYLPRRFARAFLKVWRELTDIEYNHNEILLTEQELNQLPTVLFQFKGDIESNKQLGSNPFPLGTLGSAVPDSNRKNDDNFDVIVAMNPSHYMEYKLGGFYTNRLYLEEDYGSYLGANFMMGHDITFSVEDGRIGWAESDCDYLGLLDELDEPNPWENGDGNDGDKGDSEGEDETSGSNSGDHDTSDSGSSGGGDSVGDSPSAKQAKNESSSGWSTAGVMVVVFFTMTIGVAGGLFGKRYYDQHYGTAHYQVADDNELELQVSSTAADEYKYSSSFTIS